MEDKIKELYDKYNDKSKVLTSQLEEAAASGAWRECYLVDIELKHLENTMYDIEQLITTK